MLMLALASLLATPTADQPWSSILRPAVVVQDSEIASQPEVPATDEASVASQVTSPQLVPAKTVKSRSKTAKRGTKRPMVASER
ncbi:MAG: hypothetical protein WAT51_16125 [Holophaga sp.]